MFSSYDKNKIHPSCEAFKDSKKGIATGGISYTYAMETLKNTGMVKNLKVATPHPFPEKLAVEFLTGLDEVLLSGGIRSGHRAGNLPTSVGNTTFR